MSDIYYGSPSEHSQSFMELQDIISNEASIALDALTMCLEKGWTKEEIVKDFNTPFESEDSKFKTYEEIVVFLENVGF